MKIKCDFHIHSNEDKKEQCVSYSARQIVDIYHQHNYNIISITNHDFVYWNKEIFEYARLKKIILLPGEERTIGFKHVLLINTPASKKKKLKLKDLFKYKTPHSLIIAPHPFFPSLTSLRGKLIRYNKLFDAIEFSHFYTKRLNFNKKAKRLAMKWKKPLIGNSDMHFDFQFGLTYSLLEVKDEKIFQDILLEKDINKSIEKTISLIKNSKIVVVSRPISWKFIFKFICKLFYMTIKSILSN